MTAVAIPLVLIVLIGIVSWKVDNRTRALLLIAVLIAILFLFTSGTLLATADIKTFIGSGFFIAKLSLVTLLMVNGSVLAFNERSLRRAAASGSLDDRAQQWPRLRATAWISLFLWMATLIAGVLLANLV